MNDGMSLVYASFATIVLFIVMFVIIPFQTFTDKEIYQNLTVVINSFVIFFMMYGQKAIRMILYPEKNTKSYFQAQRMQEIRQKVDELTSQSTSRL